MPEDLSNLPDPDLIARARQGDERAKTEIVRRHRSDIFRETLAVVRDWDAADSLTHQTFIEAFEVLGTWRGEGEFQAWLHGIATHLVLSRLRKDKRAHPTIPIEGSSMDTTPDPKSIAAIQILSPDQGPLDEALLGELRHRIEDAMSYLRYDQRQAFEMHLQGSPHHEIAEALSIPLDTVRTFITRARKKVEKAVEDIREP